MANSSNFAETPSATESSRPDADRERWFLDNVPGSLRAECQRAVAEIGRFDPKTYSDYRDSLPKDMPLRMFTWSARRITPEPGEATVMGAFAARTWAEAATIVADLYLAADHGKRFCDPLVTRGRQCIKVFTAEGMTRVLQNPDVLERDAEDAAGGEDHG